MEGRVISREVIRNAWFVAVGGGGRASGGRVVEMARHMPYTTMTGFEINTLRRNDIDSVVL
jgi:hypothetical protein